MSEPRSNSIEKDRLPTTVRIGNTVLNLRELVRENRLMREAGGSLRDEQISAWLRERARARGLDLDGPLHESGKREPTSPGII